MILLLSQIIVISPPVRGFMPPEKARGLEPETRMNQANTDAAKAALKSHVAGASHRQSSSHWVPEKKGEPATSVTNQFKNFFFNPNKLEEKLNITVQRKTGPGTKDPKDLSKGKMFVYKNGDQTGVSFAEREPNADPESRSLVGLLEPSRRKT